MLSTGWSDFVNKKQLVAGDEIVFLRYNGELRVGVRRGRPRQQHQASIVISSQIIYLGVLNRSVKPETVFYVHYKPRTTPFLVGINEYLKATSRAYHIGMRFKSAGDDGLTGTIVGIGDYSQYWPGSQWRSLKVRWDHSEGTILKPADSRVSPWEIEPLAADPSLQSSVLFQTIVRKKRSRLDIDVLASAASNSIRRPRSSIQSLREESTLLPLGCGFEGQNNNHNNGHNNLEGFLPNSTPGFNSSNKASSSTATPSSGIWNEQMGSQRADNHHPMGCRIFGIELASDITANTSSVTGKQLMIMASNESTVKNQCNRTKVHMQGTAFGRTVDLTTLNGYEDLITKLEEMFGIRGDRLSTAEKWVVVFIDDEGDMMLVGDDPWPEFCKMVKKIVIYSSEEMKKMKGRFRLVMSPLEG
ncbi:unnamed protein product [Linum tenue]|uniref:Auxin response factor n=1 Tax=Linum tenue TaxID=586396 RepID=A0AAV0P7J2_9ROSI|nr:unnamed protein product [Linum tenue]